MEVSNSVISYKQAITGCEHRERGNTSAGTAESRQEVERGTSEWRRITEVWLLSAIIRVVQPELTLPPSLTLSYRQTSERLPCQARLVCSAPPEI